MLLVIYLTDVCSIYYDVSYPWAEYVWKWLTHILAARIGSTWRYGEAWLKNLVSEAPKKQ